MEENLPPSQVPVNPVPPVQPPPPKRFPLKQILVVVLVVGIFFAPIPFYVSGDRAVCLGIDICPRQGWNLGPSLWQRISGGFFLRQSTQPSSPLTPIPAPDPTANWKTYIDSNFGYSFKYPADYKPYFKNGNVFYSSDAQFDKTTTAKTSGIDIGSTVYGPGEDTQEYIGPNTKMDSILSSKLVLPSGLIAKAYVNLEDITVTIDYKKSNKNMRLILWCGGEKGNSSGCENVLTPLLSTFKFIDETNTEAKF